MVLKALEHSIQHKVLDFVIVNVVITGKTDGGPIRGFQNTGYSLKKLPGYGVFEEKVIGIQDIEKKFKGRQDHSLKLLCSFATLAEVLNSWIS